MEPDIKRWTAKRKAALVMEITQGKTTAAQGSLSFALRPGKSKPAKSVFLSSAHEPISWHSLA
jgi:hypothetical protein